MITNSMKLFIIAVKSAHSTKTNRERNMEWQNISK